MLKPVRPDQEHVWPLVRRAETTRRVPMRVLSRPASKMRIGCWQPEQQWTGKPTLP